MCGHKWEISAPFAQFCCELRASLKNKVYKTNKLINCSLASISQSRKKKNLNKNGVWNPWRGSSNTLRNIACVTQLEEPYFTPAAGRNNFSLPSNSLHCPTSPRRIHNSPSQLPLFSYKNKPSFLFSRLASGSPSFLLPNCSSLLFKNKFIPL